MCTEYILRFSVINSEQLVTPGADGQPGSTAGAAARVRTAEWFTRMAPVARDQLHEQQQQHLDPTVAPDVVRRETVPGVPGVPGGRRAPAHFSESRRAWTEPVPTHIIDMANRTERTLIHLRM